MKVICLEAVSSSDSRDKKGEQAIGQFDNNQVGMEYMNPMYLRIGLLKTFF
jgi:hypothetical protein